MDIVIDGERGVGDIVDDDLDGSGVFGSVAGSCDEFYDIVTGRFIVVSWAYGRGGVAITE